MSKVLFKLSGSIAAYKACYVISALVQEGHEVQVVATKDVFHFVGESTLEGLTGREVLSDIHQRGDVMSHIHLNTWADVSILCPASANTMAKIAQGFSDNLLTTLALARDPEKPYLIFPAMNPKMWSARATQKNIKRLYKYGFQMYKGEAGRMACGDVGEGRLLEPEDILKILQPLLRPRPQNEVKRTKILVTAGGTSERIDAVRVFTNTSTGRTGAQIAQHLSRDFDVTFVGSSLALKALKQPLGFLNEPALRTIEYETFAELQSCLKKELETYSYEAVIHAAAVSDFQPVALLQEGRRLNLPLEEKLTTSPSVEIEFMQNPKLIQSFKEWSKNTEIKVVGFKLLQDKDPQVVSENINKVLQNSDYVVLNFIDEVNEHQHKYSIYQRQSGEQSEHRWAHGSTNAELADHLLTLLQDVHPERVLSESHSHLYVHDPENSRDDLSVSGREL